MHRIGLALCALVANLATGPVQASTLVFTYGTGATAIGGSLTGTLQGDSNTFLVTGGSDFSFGGALVFESAPSLLGSFDSWLTGVPAPALVTLNGSALDLVVKQITPDSGFAFAVQTIAAAQTGQDFVATTGAYAAAGTQAYAPSLWSANISLGPVPEPTGLALLGSGLLGLCLARRRKA